MFRILADESDVACAPVAVAMLMGFTVFGLQNIGVRARVNVNRGMDVVFRRILTLQYLES